MTESIIKYPTFEKNAQYLELCCLIPYCHSKNCKKASETTLRGILEYAKDTEWGKAHNFLMLFLPCLNEFFLPFPMQN